MAKIIDSRIRVVLDVTPPSWKATLQACWNADRGHAHDPARAKRYTLELMRPVSDEVWSKNGIFSLSVDNEVIEIWYAAHEGMAMKEIGQRRDEIADRLEGIVSGWKAEAEKQIELDRAREPSDGVAEQN